MMKISNIVASLVFGAVILGCGSTAPILRTPIENIDQTPLKTAELSDFEKNNWGHLDLVKDTIPGMSVNKAYAEILNGKKSKSIVVAVIDSGIDIDHEDLDDVIWTNPKEIVGNGKDDDKNGYVDDIHGWNFLGDAYDEQLEFVRLLASGNTADPRFEEAKQKYEKDRGNAEAGKTRYEQLYQNVTEADKAISEKLGKSPLTKEDIVNFEPDTDKLKEYKTGLMNMFNYGFDSIEAIKDQMKGGLNYFSDQLNFNVNKDFKGRTTGDNIEDITDTGYGNGNVKPIKEDESHGTHVAGIIAAERNNNLGANGVADNVQIMAIRAVPNGDEYDKDVALAIRYAVDNGAKVINCSFGKSYSPHSDWVHDAVKYAAKNDVLIVHAAGNSSEDIDTAYNFPTDNIKYQEIANNYISVGAIGSKYGSEMVAGFSNYGKNNVDIFAPGAAIYSAIPFSKYKHNSGTSMASPAVAGVAALIRSYFPDLKASQVKEIILSTGLPITTQVLVGGNPENVKPLSEISKTGRIVNAYNALIKAEQISKY